MDEQLSKFRANIKSHYNKRRNSVALRVLINTSTIEFQTGIKCTLLDFQNEREVQIIIEDHISILANCFAKYSNTGVVRDEYYKLRNSADLITNKEPLCFFQIIEEFIQIYSGTLATTHLRNFDIMRRSLKVFINKPTLPTDLLSSMMLNNYTHSLVKSGIENSTIKGYLKRLKRVVRYANEHKDAKIELSFDQIDQLKDKVNFVVFLDKSEVEQFAEVYTITPGELEVKNGFLFRCYTGIRFSEMTYIDINNVHGGVLSFYIPKTSKSHQIPLNRKALEMLKKVERFSPISQQKENMYIKRLARRAKIERPVQRVKLSGSVSTVETHPKWKLCSSHTARRTFARIAYDSGVNILKISRYIGHSDIATTLKYIGHKDTDFDELKDLF